MWILEEVLDGAVLGKNISHTTGGLHILDKTCTHTHVYGMEIDHTAATIVSRNAVQKVWITSNT